MRGPPFWLAGSGLKTMNGLRHWGLAAALAAAAAMGLPTGALPAGAQQAAQPKGQDTPIGPPQLQDFDLGGRRQPAQTRPAPTLPTPAPTTAQPTPAARTPRPQPAERATTPQTTAPTTRAPAPAPATEPVRSPAPDVTAPAPDAGTPTSAAPIDTGPVPATPQPEAAPAPAPATGGLDDGNGVPMWLLLLGGLAAGLGIYVLLQRRRRAALRREASAPEPAAEQIAVATTPAAPRVPRADPVPRPWLEIEFSPERTTADPNESVVEFELTIRNNGGSTARNILLQAKLICSTPDQDKEIAAFHRKKPGEHRTLEAPDIPPGQEIRLKGRVDVKREDLKALRMDQRLIWVPLVAVNSFYEWGSARRGQTSKSFLVGREQPETKDKMAPFRLDLGPRVYRTVGQRPYKIERRV